MSENSTLRYIHQDHLTGTAVVSDNTGSLVSSTKYYPYGDSRNSTGDLATDKLFTGQRLDDTGLYYYNARYYDPAIGRFISADTIVPDFTNPQALNRYAYCINNPLKYNDPSGHFWDWFIDWASILYDAYEFSNNPSWGNAGLFLADVVLGVVPFVPAGAGPVVKAASHGDDVFDAVRGFNKADEAIDAGKGVIKAVDDLPLAVKKTFRNEEFIDVELKPGDKIYRSYEAGNPNSNPISSYATDFDTASGISSTQAAIDELAIPSVRPNRMVELEVTSPITVQYGLIKGGGNNAYQYYIDPKNFNALKVTGERLLK